MSVVMLNHPCCVRGAVAGPGPELLAGAHQVRISPATGRGVCTAGYFVVYGTVRSMSSDRLTPTSYLVLGLLAREGPSTPYDLERHVRATLGNFWSFPHTLLYTEPPRLAALGLVTETRETEGRRRRIFTITPAGQAALEAWLDRPSGASTELRDLGLLQLFFADLASDRGTAASGRATTRPPSGEARGLPGGRAVRTAARGEPDGPTDRRALARRNAADGAALRTRGRRVLVGGGRPTPGRPLTEPDGRRPTAARRRNARTRSPWLGHRGVALTAMWGNSRRVEMEGDGACHQEGPASAPRVASASEARPVSFGQDEPDGSGDRKNTRPP